MKYIYTPNPEPPHNLIQICPNYTSSLYEGWSEDDVIQRVVELRLDAGLIPIGNPWWAIEETDLPEAIDDAYFFDCWEHDGVRIVVDMDKARAFHMARIRVARNAELVAEDIKLNAAQDKGDAVEERAVRLRRQTLRDIPQTFDLSGITNPTELRAAWPDTLVRP